MKCSSCDKPNDRAPQRYCSECHAAYQRKWRRERTALFHEFLAQWQPTQEAN